MKKVRITLIKGTVRRLPVHRANVKALGLRKIGQSVEHVLTPSIQGMINAVADMVKVEEYSQSWQGQGRQAQAHRPWSGFRLGHHRWPWPEGCWCS